MSDTWQPIPPAEHERRAQRRVLWTGRVLIACLSLILLALLVRVGQLQIQPSPRVVRLLENQQSTADLTARRGALLDRRGRVLAATRVAQRLFVDPALIVDRNTFSERVGYGLGYDPTQIDRALHEHSRSRYIVIDPRMDDAKAEACHDLDVPGLATEPVLVRDYPQGPLAGQLLGFVGAAGQGLEGLELAWQRRLTGSPGSYGFLRDARRRTMWAQNGSYQPHDDGQSVRLSLDITIQALAEQKLTEAVERYGAESGQMIVMDPATGEILAMANYPLLDPNHFGQADPALRRNRCVTDVFEPGSIFKPFVWAALTERGVAQPEEMFDCTEAGVWRSSQGRRLRDAHGLGELTWDDVLVKSSNIGMAMAAERITVEQLHAIVESYGFGQTTGSTLPGELPGLVNPLKRWNHYSQTSIPMGQEIGVTGLQVVRAFCALANGGLLPTPTIEALDPATNPGPPPQRRVLGRAAADHTRAVLRRVVTEGTGRKADSELYELFGKTGTAQLPDFINGGYHQDQYVSSFLAGAPADQPRLVIGCFIHKPDRKKGHYGGTVAAPAVMEVMEQALLYLGVPPQVTADEVNQEIPQGSFGARTDSVATRVAP